ncbi:MAG TPA: 1-deoxy-D-xylulose-5-phosphate reductoisomerase, partial [Desulfobacteria bacterium]|nr:1-deoxy-D-xylulose-5-phosphate reductoisomerase [Desulfobacteria bacterium]
TYPDRRANRLERLNLIGKTLSFEEPDLVTFPALTLALAAGKRGGTMPAVLNAANEVAVNLFLQDKIGFLAIADLVEKVISRHRVVDNPDLDQILTADSWAREESWRLIN